MRDVRENLVTNCTACSPGRRDAVGHRRPPWATLPPSGAPSPPHPGSARPPGSEPPKASWSRSPAPPPPVTQSGEGMRWGKGPDVYQGPRRPRGHCAPCPALFPRLCISRAGVTGCVLATAARPGPASRQLRAESRGLSCRAGPTQVPSHPAHPPPARPAAPPPHVATCHLPRPPRLQVPGQPRHFPSSLSLWPGSHPPVPSPRGQPLTAPGRREVSESPLMRPFLPASTSHLSLSLPVTPGLSGPRP